MCHQSWAGPPPPVMMLNSSRPPVARCRLADARAVVKNLTDVETLGATSAINTDKTGTLTMNEMMVSVIYAAGAWFNVEGEGYRKTGAITSVAGAPVRFAAAV